ncbi:MAG: hypothetical protein WBA55_12805 [Allopontixanthobacter sediminis]
MAILHQRAPAFWKEVAASGEETELLSSLPLIANSPLSGNAPADAEDPGDIAAQTTSHGEIGMSADFNGMFALT